MSVSEIQERGFCFEHTALYRMIKRASRASLKDAWRLVATMKDEEIQERSEKDQSSYLHHIVNQVRASLLLDGALILVTVLVVTEVIITQAFTRWRNICTPTCWLLATAMIFRIHDPKSSPRQDASDSSCLPNLVIIPIMILKVIFHHISLHEN